LLNLLAFVIGVLVYWRIAGAGAVLEKVYEWIAFGIVGVGGLAILLLLWNLIVAPYRMYEKDLQDTEALRQQVQMLESKMKPKLSIEFRGREATYYQFMEDLQMDGGPATQELYRIAVYNHGNANVHSRVRVELVAIDPQPHDLIGLPLPLHLVHDNVPPYRQEVDIAGEGEQYVDLVAYTKSEKLGVLSIEHTVSGINREVPSGKYALAIRAVGEGTYPTTARFGVSAEGSKLRVSLLGDELPHNALV
jgi:hypothetical protein